MRRLAAVLLFLAFLIPTQPVHAQGAPVLSSVTIWIWPEYDKPSVLVVYHIMVSEQTTFPTTLIFRIPAAVVKPFTVAVGNSPDTVSDQNVQYSLENDGKWVDVLVNMTGPALTLEYYDPSIVVEGKHRQYVYSWPGGYKVSSLKVEVQEPYDASQFQVTPTLEQEITANDRLTYYQGDFGALALGTPFTLELNYQKASNSVSVDLMPVEPVAPVNANTPGRVSLGTYVPWLVGGLGVLLIAGGLYYFFRRQPRPTSGTRRHHAARTEPSGSQTYCPQCGARARAGDRFCRTCGSRLRQNNED